MIVKGGFVHVAFALIKRITIEMSQKKLANALGVSFATINRWENSRNEPSQLAKNSFYEFCESNFIDVNELKKL